METGFLLFQGPSKTPGPSQECVQAPGELNCQGLLQPTPSPWLLPGDGEEMWAGRQSCGAGGSCSHKNDVGRGELWMGMDSSLACTSFHGANSPAWEHDMGYPGDICSVGGTRLSLVPFLAGRRRFLAREGA